jgi:hypothetical protein
MTTPHETRTCPRCGEAFQCKPGNITQCQCFGVELSLEESAFVEERYEDCLCRSCLMQLKNRYILFKEKYFFR